MVLHDAFQDIDGSPPLTIWRIITRPEEYRKFFRLASEVTSTGEEVSKPGDELAMKLRLGVPIRLRVVEARENQALSIKSYYGMRFQVGWQLVRATSDTTQDGNDGTRVRLQVSYLLPYSVHGKILEEEPTRNTMAEQVASTVVALKGVAESISAENEKEGRP